MPRTVEPRRRTPTARRTALRGMESSRAGAMLPAASLPVVYEGEFVGRVEPFDIGWGLLSYSFRTPNLSLRPDFWLRGTSPAFSASKREGSISPGSIRYARRLVDEIASLQNPLRAMTT